MAQYIASRTQVSVKFLRITHLCSIEFEKLGSYGVHGCQGSSWTHSSAKAREMRVGQHVD